MIEYGSEKYKSGIKRLWNEAFGDSLEVIDKYLENMCKNEDILLYTENGEVCAMASILPVLASGIKGRYVYAVATGQEYRGRGYCKALMKAVDDCIKERGEGFAVLVPASKSLFEFYEKLGYTQRVNKPPVQEIKGTGNPCTVSEYYKIRDKVLKNTDYIRWSKDALEYILSWGKTEYIENGVAYFEGENAVEVLSPEILKKEWTEPFALIKYIDNSIKFEKPYFGLAMN